LGRRVASRGGFRASSSQTSFVVASVTGNGPWAGEDPVQRTRTSEENVLGDIFSSTEFMVTDHVPSDKEALVTVPIL